MYRLGRDGGRGMRAIENVKAGGGRKVLDLLRFCCSADMVTLIGTTKLLQNGLKAAPLREGSLSDRQE